MKSLLIVKFFLHKTKRQFVAIIVMALLSAFLLNSVLILATDYHENYYVRHDETNSANVIAVYSAPFNHPVEEIEDILDGEEEIEQYEIGEYITAYISIGFDGGILSTNSTLIELNDAKNKKIGPFEIVEGSEDSGVYLPYVYLANREYEIGDTVEFSLNSLDFSMRVAGFYNSITAGTINTQDITLLMTGDCLEEVRSTLLAEYPTVSSIQVLIRLKNPDNAEKYESTLLALLDSGVSGTSLIYSSNYIKMASNRYTSEAITFGILALATFFIEIVLLSIIAISLSGFCRENIRNLGTLKAMGYVSRQLIGSLVVCCTLIGVMASAVGILFSYVSFPLLNNMMERQVGIPYRIHFMFLTSLITVLVVSFTMMLSTFFSVIKLHHIEPIMAIRGIRTNTRKSRIIPLHSTHLGLNGALTAKTILTGMRRNIVILITMLFVGLMLGTACFCYQQSHEDLDKICALVVGKSTDSIITVLPEEEASLIKALAEDDRVMKYYLYTMQNVCQKDGGKITVHVADETVQDNSGFFCIEGRLPEIPEEIAVNRFYLRQSGLNVGDNITFTAKGEEVTYSICGAIQTAQNSGRDAFLLQEGYERLCDLPFLTYYVDLDGETDIDSFNEEIITKAPVYRVENYNDFLYATSGPYIRVIQLLSMILVYLCAGITVLIIYILVSLLLENKKREHGILKALGFTSNQIIIQTALSITPISALGAIVGLCISRENAGRFFAMLLGNMGVYNMDLPIRPIYLIICGVALLVLAFAASCLLSGKVRRIVPHSLFNNE